MKSSKSFIIISAAALALAATAGELDRPQGYKIGQRLTLRPYVSMSYTYDSNVDSSKKSHHGSSWTVNPGIGVDYIADNWSIVGDAFYRYHAYNNYSSQLNSSSYGENLTFNWRNSAANERGWSLTASQHFEQVSQDDDMSNHGGRGYGRDRKEFRFDGAVERRWSQYVHTGLTAGYYLLDYENNVSSYAPLYGWKRTNVGVDAGYVASKWLDFVVAADYQWYQQDNNTLRSGSYFNNLPQNQKNKGRNISGNSRGWSIMGGIATRATERLDYRLMAGVSRFEYSNGLSDANGFIYQISAHWRIEDRLSFMLLGSSYYQPSETSYGSATKVYTFSAGLAKSWGRRVTTSLDLAYRKESSEYSQYATNDYDSDYWTGRFGINYHLNRYFTCFGNIEYQFCDSGRQGYEYDRWRGTVGVRLAY